jgi:hypothetical protein
VSEVILEEQFLHYLKTVGGDARLWHVVNGVVQSTPHLKTRSTKREYALHVLQAYKSLRNKGKVVYIRRRRSVAVRP